MDTYRTRQASAIDLKRRSRGLSFNQLAKLSQLERHEVVKTLVGSPETANFPTLVALATAVGHDLVDTDAGEPVAAG